MLNFLLLICENRVFWCDLSSLISNLLITRNIHAQSFLMLAGRPLDGISVGPWISSVCIGISHVVSLFMLTICCHSHHGFRVWWWIMIRVEIWIRHAFVLLLYVVLVWVHRICHLRSSLAWSSPIDTLPIIWQHLSVALGWIWILVKISDRYLTILSSHHLLLLGCHGSEGSTILLSCSWIRSAWNVFKMIRFLRILLLREGLNRSSLTWQSLRCAILTILMS